MNRRLDTTLTRRDLLQTAATAFTFAGSTAGYGQPAARSIDSQASVTSTFSRERFVEDCIAACRESDSQGAVGEVLARAVSNHRAVLATLGPPQSAGLDVLHRSTSLTIFNAKWAPHMTLPAHDHRLWALIGIYVGREDNILWRRASNAIEASGATVLFPGESTALPTDVIHSVTNPLDSFTGGIHVYGGDFFATPRSQWDNESLQEEPSNGDVIAAFFARENARRAACAGRL